MFGTVEFYERENNLKERVRRLFLGDRIIAERVNLPENECFYRLRVPLHKGNFPEDRLKRMASSFTDGLIFPHMYSYEGEIRQYRSSYFRDIILFNSAISQLEKSVFDPTETLITVIDRKGTLHTEIHRLIKFAGELKVITDNVRAYESEALKIMREYGLSLLISNKLSAIPERGIIISKYSDSVPVYFKGLLITGEKRLLPFARILIGEGVRSSGVYENLCPEGINMTDFLSALCEVCFIRELRKSECEKLVDISV